MSLPKEILIVDEEEVVEILLPSPPVLAPTPSLILTQLLTPPAPLSLLSSVVEVTPSSPLAQVGASASEEALMEDKELIEMVVKVKQSTSSPPLFSRTKGWLRGYST